MIFLDLRSNSTSHITDEKMVVQIKKNVTGVATKV